jgi:transposase
VQRSKILLGYADGEPISRISERVGAARDTVYKCIDKALAMGAFAGLKDTYHRPFEPRIDDEAKAWVVALACTKPKELGYAAEVWSRKALATHVRKHAASAGYPALSRAAKVTVHRILTERSLRPEKVRYYLERRDPEFEPKMKQILIVYKEVSLEQSEGVITVCVDEKPGVQAIANTAADLPPVPNKYETISRDHEYKRLGTLSIIAALDLHDGHVLARVERRHRSVEFIHLLKDLDAYYPEAATIRIVLDNHSSHISKETRAYLATRPGRFEYVHTPKHGSWLNLAENLFGKMARTFLRHIRVESRAELRERILRGIAEMNEQPTIFRWSKLDEIGEKI